MRQVTNEKASVERELRMTTRRALLINYADPTTPPTLFTVASIDQIGDRDVVAPAHRCQSAGPRLRA